PQPVQPGLALRLAAGVTEDQIARAEDDIGDDLLEARVVLDLRAGPELGAVGNKQAAQVALRFTREALKPAKPVKLSSRNNQDALGMGLGLAHVFFDLAIVEFCSYLGRIVGFAPVPPP